MNQNTEAVVEQIDEEPSFEKIGLIFKNAREGKNITIVEASQELHIRQLYINAIETGNLSALPGHVYKIGFIKTYARFLNLEPTQILKDFGLQEEIAPDYSSFNYSVPIEQQKRPNMKVILGATTLLFIGGVILYVSNNITHEEPVVIAAPSKMPLTIENQAIIQPHDLPNSTLTPDESSTTITTTPSSEHPADTAAMNAEDLSVKILATKDAWVQVTDENGKAVFVRLMRAGETYSVPTTGKYHLNTGNGAGVKLSIGDKVSEPLGEDGKVIRGISLEINDVQKLLS